MQIKDSILWLLQDLLKLRRFLADDTNVEPACT